MATKRVLLKISGETLVGESNCALDPVAVNRLIDQISLLEIPAENPGDPKKLSCELAIVVGGGNFFRGSVQGVNLGMSRVPRDYAGMIATIVNGIALTEVLEKRGFRARHMSAIETPKVAELYIYRRAIRHLEKGRIVVLTAGTGNPRATTDTAMVLRGVELEAEMVLKGTKVDGVYDKDPKKFKEANFLREISYGRFLQLDLGILDATAVSSARADNMPIRVFNIFTPGNLRKIIEGENIGSVITSL